MKKIFILSILISIAKISWGQSITIDPQKIENKSTNEDNNLRLESIGTNSFPYINALKRNGTSGSPTPVTVGQSLLRIDGQGQYASSFGSYDVAARIGMIAADNFNGTQNPGAITFLTAQTIGLAERMRITQNGRIGIGLPSPASLMHVHEGGSNTIAKFKLTNQHTGFTENDGLELQILAGDDLFFPGAARIINKENSQLFLGANNSIMMNITPTGNVGINSLLGGAPTARFQILHDTENNATKPHINLVTAVNANNGMIKMSNLTATRYFGQYFNLNSGTAANNFLSFDYNGTTPILDLKGNGNVEVAGFTKLGSEASAPKIKMKTLTSVTGATQGAANSPTMFHGVTASKIISVSLFVDFGLNFFIPPGFVAAPGEQYDYQITGDRIETFNHPTNSGNILSKPIKVVITYIE